MSKPTILKYENAVFCDVDETLVCWVDTSKPHELPLDMLRIKDPYEAVTNHVVPHWPNIKVLKSKRMRGSEVVVWSANGWQWARAVVEALGLQDYVDVIMSKPGCYIDDKPAEAFMGERIFLPSNSNYR